MSPRPDLHSHHKFRATNSPPSPWRRFLLSTGIFLKPGGAGGVGEVHCEWWALHRVMSSGCSLWVPGRAAWVPGSRRLGLVLQDQPALTVVGGYWARGQSSKASAWPATRWVSAMSQHHPLSPSLPCHHPPVPKCRHPQGDSGGS